MHIAVLMALTAILSCVGAASHADDWLISSTPHPAKVDVQPSEIVLHNGLLERRFLIHPDFAAVGYRNLSTGVELVRSIKPEARVSINGKWWNVGGAAGVPEHAYLRPEWFANLKAHDDSFHFARYTIGTPVERFPWKRSRYNNTTLAWPPRGVSLAVEFNAPPQLEAEVPGLTVTVHYELYDGIPAMSKWISVKNSGPKLVRLSQFETEVLALIEVDPAVEFSAGARKPPVHFQSDYAFGGGTMDTSDQTTHWQTDPEFDSQINYERISENMVVIKPMIGPNAQIDSGGEFTSFRSFQLLFGSDDRERRGLEMRRFQQTVAPWSSENPILMHLRYSDSESIHRAVDQCADVGFEMIVLTFGSGFQPESSDPKYIARMKADVGYAHSKGIEIGGYTLTASRGAGPENNVKADNYVNPKTGKKGAIFGQSPCLASTWSDGYYARMRHFYEATGMDMIEDDGSYPGDICTSTTHAHHTGVEDSQWNQWKTITTFYQYLRANGKYINAPDYYFFSGSNKSAMGYRESNWSLSRDRQIMLGRQNIFDGTWEKTASMGWMFVPLVEYQGGGEAATLEPLKDHLDAYGAHLAQNFLSGVQACYRGPRLYDAPETRNVVKKWVDLYKAHRAILDSDIIHVRRPDGRHLDCMLHVNSNLQERGFAVVYNPTDKPITDNISLPLYYTGLTHAAVIREQTGKPRPYSLDRDYSVTLQVTVPARGLTWYVIKR